MEKLNISAVMIMIISLVMGLLVGQSSAYNFNCYKSCYDTCVSVPGSTPVSCTIKCADKCGFPPKLGFGSMRDTQYFCNLGCASSLCTKHNPLGVKKVSHCLEFCTNTCAKK